MALRKKDVLYGEILERLVTARYRFGERILVKELCAETGASRQPIMAALNALANDGFVRVIPQVGCAVVSPRLQDIADFYRLFARLEGLLAEIAASRHSDGQIKALKKINLRIMELDPADPGAGEDYRLLNLSFHSTLHQMAQSPLLDTRQASLFAMSDFFVSQTGGFNDQLDHAPEEHATIIDAIADRDAQRACCAAESHIAHVGALVLARFSASTADPATRPLAGIPA
jgi:DNA-binding GntR family transcriptional regulator